MLELIGICPDSQNIWKGGSRKSLETYFSAVITSSISINFWNSTDTQCSCSEKWDFIYIVRLMQETENVCSSGRMAEVMEWTEFPFCNLLKFSGWIVLILKCVLFSHVVFHQWVYCVFGANLSPPNCTDEWSGAIYVREKPDLYFM